MPLTLTVVKAKHGDALILTHDRTNVLIDGGPPGVWKNFLAAQVARLDANPSDHEPPVIDLMMVSHIDSDHIAGIIDLTEDMIEANEEGAMPPASIRRAWVNTFSDAILEADIETDEGDAAGAAASLASTFEGFDLGLVGDTEHTELMLSSVGQGRSLRRNLKTLHVPINKRFRQRLALGDGADGPWKRRGLSIDVIGPTTQEIEALREAWKKALPKILAKEEKAARTAAATSLDRSVYNLASIVVIASAGGRRMLLTGDARGDMICEWLDTKGLTGQQHFEVLKLPHHGSDRNVDAAFFQRIIADHYVISGDGNHGNPEPDVLDMIFDTRGDAGYTIHLTYSPDEIKAHKKFKSASDKALDAVLAKAPWRAGKLNWPDPGQNALTISI